LPSVNKIYREFKDRGLEILLVDIRESPDLVRRTVKERGYVAPVLLDQSGDVAGRQWGVWGTPTAYFIDRQGRLTGMMIGARDWSKPEARRLIQSLLGPLPKS
jgi:AhpC/TSA family